MGASEYEKVSVSMPSDVLAQTRARVTPRAFSAYVTAAVRRQLERDALDEILARMEAEHGPVDEGAVEATLARLR